MQTDSQKRVEYSKDEFYAARKAGKSWDEALQLARDSYNMTEAEYAQMLHELH